MARNISNSEISCCSCARRSPLFSALTDEEIKLVNQNKATILFKKGEIIRKQGEPMTHVISVNSGFAKIYLEGGNRSNTMIRIVKPNNFIGGPGIYSDQLHHYTISALTDTKVCYIDVNLFRNLIDTNKKFAHLFMKDFSSNIISVFNRLVYLTQKHMPGRMADTLFYLFDVIFESEEIDLDLSKQDLADFCGMSKESAIKVLREFQKSQIVLYSENKMALLDEKALRRISKMG